MIINRRTSFTNTEYPNHFEDPQWDTFDNIPNKTLVASANATVGYNKSYKVPDGQGGWYAMRVISRDASGTATGTTLNGSWSYTYLHEGSTVFLWGGGSNRVRPYATNNLGAPASTSVCGGEAGILCGFKQSDTIDSNNYGIYKTFEPQKVADMIYGYHKWVLKFADGREIERYKGGSTWDPNGAFYILIDGKLCLSFEDPYELSNSATEVVDGGGTVFDSVYLCTTPMQFSKCAFSASAGLVIGQTGSSSGNGGGALGSSLITYGPTFTFGMAPSDSTNGGIAFFDFTRDIFESNQRSFTTTTEDAGAYLYKITEAGHDYTQPYAQLFTADETLSDATFTFYINDVEYHFPSVWPNANKQKAFSGEYRTYIQNVHIGDILHVVVNYANGKVGGAYYIITMHSLVYGLHLNKLEFLWKERGTYSVLLPAGTYYTYIHGGGGAGGNTAAATSLGASGTGGAGGKGDFITSSFVLADESVVSVYVGPGGLTYNNGGNGGAQGTAHDSETSAAGGGGGYPSYVKTPTQIIVAPGGGGGGGGAASGQKSGRYSNSGCGGGGGGYYRPVVDGTSISIVSVPGKTGAPAGGDDDGSGSSGTTGNTIDFPTVYSGSGGDGGYYDGVRGHGGAMAYGGGASGAGGGAGAGNHTSSRGGGGGGGAGGSLDASGGGRGMGYRDGKDGFNFHTTPTKTINYLNQVMSNGWGIGGTTNMNGADGWVYIAAGEAVSETISLGAIGDTPTEWALGSITEEVSEIKDCGNII